MTCETLIPLVTREGKCLHVVLKAVSLLVPDTQPCLSFIINYPDNMGLWSLLGNQAITHACTQNDFWWLTVHAWYS